MKSLAVCLMGLLVCVQAGATVPEVAGHVRFGDGQPVGGVAVVLFDLADLRRGVVAQATTDETGQFALPLASSGLPVGFALGQNYPNPFNPSTVIPYELASSAHVRLEIFNTLGQRVAVLVDGEQAAGSYTATWTATNGAGQAVAAGIYLYRLTVGGVTATGRAVLVDGGAGFDRLNSLGRASTSSDLLGVGAMDVGGRSYGLVVSGVGIEPYMDADFRVGAGSVVIEVAAQRVGRAKVVASGILGDVDNNGEVNLLDALLVAMYIANPASGLPEGINMALGDVNGDGVLNFTDAWLVGTYALDPSAAGLPAGIGEQATAGELVGGFDAPTRLTDHEGADDQPSWSPDGTQLVFRSNRDGKLNIYVMGSDGSNPTRLTAEDYNSSPSWSPDGTKIAFSSGDTDGDAIYVMGSDGSDATRLTYRGNNGSPSWSPDGARIAFASTPTPSANLEIYVMGSDGSNLTRLTDTGWNDSPVWSPDGSKIAFVSNRGTGEVDTFDIYVMGSDGSNPTRLTDAGDNRSPSWSPDGTRIAFQSTRDGETDIYVMGSDGSDATRLTATGDNRSPSWSPDGTRIAFLSTRDGNWDIYAAVLAEGSDASVAVVDIPVSGGAAGEERAFPLPGGGEMEFVWIEPGTFMMGSPDTELGRRGNEGPVHEVEISKGFWLGKYEVTAGQFRGFIDATEYDAENSCMKYRSGSASGGANWRNPGYAQADDHPVVGVSWVDVFEYADWLSGETGALYRLPTEAEWEYACRAGSRTRWSLGDEDGNDERLLHKYAWYRTNTSPFGTKAVGGKLPNSWGLYDMHGNVSEWVRDWYGEDYYNSSPRVDPLGPDTGSSLVVRGGSFRNDAQYVRSANRSTSGTYCSNLLGFRLVRIR